HREPEPGRDREHENRVTFSGHEPEQGRDPDQRRIDAAEEHNEHHRVTKLHTRVQLRERVADRSRDDWPREEIHRALDAQRSGIHAQPLPIICRCSTIGPSASAGTNVSAPTISTTPTSHATNSGVCVGNVPAVTAVALLAARLPAIPSTGIMIRERDSHIEMASAAL